MAKLERTRVYEAAASEMWERIGDYHGIHNWHPGFADTKVGDDPKIRELILTDDRGVIVETLIDEGELHHSYRMDDASPFPVQNFVGTLMVREAGDGCEVVWSAEFEADGMPEDEVTELVNGAYDAGLDSLEQSA